MLRSFAGAVALLSLSSAALADPDTTVVHAAHLFDGAATVGERWVLVESGHIKKVSATRLEGTHTIELGASTLVYGLTDAHVHVLLADGKSLSEARLASITESSAAKALRGLEAAQRTLAAGFTTIRDPGDFDLARAHLDVRDAIASGAFVGPKIYAADRFITRTGGHYDDSWLAADQDLLPFARVADGPTELVKAVREEVKAGADWIKIAASGGSTTPNSLPFLSSFTDEELRAVVAEAHRLGKKVAAHTHSPPALKAVIAAGVDSIEHGTMIDGEQLKEMARRGIYWVPTWSTADPRGATEPDAWLKSWRKETNELAKKRIRMAVEYGVSVVLGTDAGISQHGLNARALTVMVECGMKPAEALRAATVTAAKMLDDKEAGRVAEGMRADLIAVPGDPLSDIRVMERVGFVMVNGVVAKSPAR